MDELFDLFDDNGDGVVDPTELAAGLSVLCGGGCDEKAEAAFALYDYNGDGVVTEDEMAHYLASVFKVMYHAVPIMEERLGVGAEQLAEVSAEHALPWRGGLKLRRGPLVQGVPAEALGGRRWARLPLPPQVAPRWRTLPA